MLLQGPGVDPGFQVRGGRVAHVKKLRRAEGGAKIFGVFLKFTLENRLIKAVKSHFPLKLFFKSY
jgi:hypothetical protein